jgi:integrase
MKKKMHSRSVPLDEVLRSQISNLLLELKVGELWLFQSRNGKKLTPNAANDCGLKGNISTHLMRKTFAQMIYEITGKDIMMTSRA